MARKTKRIDRRRVITVEELLGPIAIPKWSKPVFVPRGDGNGWYVWDDGTRIFDYIR